MVTLSWYRRTRLSISFMAIRLPLPGHKTYIGTPRCSGSRRILLSWWKGVNVFSRKTLVTRDMESTSVFMVARTFRAEANLFLTVRLRKTAMTRGKGVIDRHFGNRGNLRTPTSWWSPPSPLRNFLKLVSGSGHIIQSRNTTH